MATAQEPPFSKQYLPVKQYSQQENEALVKKFQELRVSDVIDGLDVVGLQDVTVMDHGIAPFWRDEKNFTHRIYGVAVTLRIVPPQERAPNFPSHAEFAKWEGNWYETKIPGDFEQYLKPDTVLVIDASRTKDVGFCGSNNALNWFTRGMRGIVTDGGCRDLDEIILEHIPLYQRGPTNGIDPGRIAIAPRGHFRAVASNRRATGRADNRRVDFKVLRTWPPSPLDKPETLDPPPGYPFPRGPHLAPVKGDRPLRRMGKRLGRGVLNLGAGWVEAPKDFTQTAADRSLGRAAVVGLPQGLLDGAWRTVIGAYETGTCFLPIEDDPLTLDPAVLDLHHLF